MVDGVMSIEIGGKSYVLPPLDLEALKKMGPLQSASGGISAEVRMDAILMTAHSALVRNCPDLTFEQLQAAIHSYELIALAKAMPGLVERAIGDLYLSELEELLDYWEDHPPVDVLVALSTFGMHVSSDEAAKANRQE
jgi:hypothetical protein